MSFKRKIPWVRQPQYPAGIDRANYLLRGTTGFWNLRDRNYIADHISGKVATLSDPSFTVSAIESSGIGTACIGATPGRYVNTGILGSALGISGSANRTIYGFTSFDVAANTAAIFTHGTPSTGNQDWSLRKNAAAGAWRFNIFGVLALDFTYSLPTGSPLAFVCTQNGTAVDIWINGASRASSTATINTTDAILKICGDVIWESWNEPVYFVGVANRAWSNTEKKNFTDNPWQIFQPLQRDIYVAAAAGGVTAALTGQSITAALGTLSDAIQASITGQAVSAALGTVSPAVVAALSGQAVSAAQGSVVAGVAPAITGQVLQAAQGSLLAGVSTPITGQAVSAALGSVTAAIQAALTGQVVTAALGDVAVAGGVTVALTGQSVTASLGSVSPVVVSALTGQSIQAVLGSVVAGVSTPITGQSATAAQGSVTASVGVTLTGQVVTAALGDVGLGGDIVRAITGQSVTAFLGSVSVLAASSTFSQEVEIRRFYMRKGKKLLMFDSVNEAEAYTQAEALADETIAKANKTSRLARKRLRTRIVSGTLPAQTIDTDWLAEMMQRYAINLDLPALLAEQDYGRVLEIHALAMKMQDEEDENDIEMLLLMG